MTLPWYEVVLINGAFYLLMALSVYYAMLCRREMRIHGCRVSPYINFNMRAIRDLLESDDAMSRDLGRRWLSYVRRTYIFGGAAFLAVVFFVLRSLPRIL